jgi:prepilin-type processing-associated H-X9-DG protein
MYTQDYDERLPAAIDGDSTTGLMLDYHTWVIDNVWIGKIYPYISNTQIFWCPSDKPSDASFNPATASLTNKTPSQWVNNVSYGWNYSGLTRAACSPAAYGCGGVSLASLDNASEIVMMTDSGGKSSHSQAQAYISCSTNSETYGPVPKHFGGTDIAFVDGHVKWSKIPGDYISSAVCAAGSAELKAHWNY